MRLIRSSHKSKFNMQEVKFESLTANDKKLLIKHYYEEPVDFIDAKSKHKVRRSASIARTIKLAIPNFTEIS